MNNFKIWKSITIGTKTKAQLLKDLKKAKVNISDYAKDMIEKVEVSTTKKQVDLVKVTVSDLGLTEGYPTTKQIYEKAQELGLALCPAQVGLYVRLEDIKQELDSWYYIGMEPIADSRGYPRVFRVVRGEDGAWLSSHDARPDSGWDPEDEFMFRLRKSLKNFDPSVPEHLATLKLGHLEIDGVKFKLVREE